MAFMVLARRATSSPLTRHRHAAVERGAGDRLDLGADRLDRSQGAAGQHPGQQATAPTSSGKDTSEALLHRVDAAPDRVERRRGEELHLARRDRSRSPG